MKKLWIDRKLLTLIIFILICVGLLITIVAIRQSQTITQHAGGGNLSNICKASDVSTLTSCVDKLTNATADAIEVTTMIDCSSADSCNIQLSGSNRQAVIFGTPGTTAGFRRTTSFTHPIISIGNSSDIDLVNLLFDENRSYECPIHSCRSTISISSSYNIRLDHISIVGAKEMGIEMSENRDVTISNSHIDDAQVFGIWLVNSQTIGTITIENTLFENNWSNAILYNGDSPADRPTRIVGNTFTHNHRKSLFQVCGPQGNLPCGGGQVLLGTPAKHILVENNRFINGRIDAGYPHVAGIEIDNDIHDLTIRNNDIHDNTSTGIYENDRNFTNISNVILQNNRVYNNGEANINFPQATSSNNCFEASCNDPVITSNITSSPFVQVTNADRCPTTINWTTSNTPTAAVIVDNALFSTSSSGSQLADWIGMGKTEFALYTDQTKSRYLGSTRIYCFISQNQSLSPTPTPLLPTHTPTNTPTSTPIRPSIRPSNAPTTPPASSLTPTRSISPSVVSPTTRITVQPTLLPPPTMQPTPLPHQTGLAMTVLLHGIGKSGDSQNPTSGGNPQPLHTQRSATLQLFDITGTRVFATTVTMMYNKSLGQFEIVTALPPSITTNWYIVKVKTSQQLQKAQQVHITTQQRTTAPAITLLTGDSNNDNVLDSLDYNVLRGCISVLEPAKACTAEQKIAADLNDDGYVNTADRTLFIRELTNVIGD